MRAGRRALEAVSPFRTEERVERRNSESNRDPASPSPGQVRSNPDTGGSERDPNESKMNPVGQKTDLSKLEPGPEARAPIH